MNMSLFHHGVKGQQWGVKHGPPYPIQKGNPVTLRAGTKISRLSIYDESVSQGRAYVNYNNLDKDHYKGFFAARLKALHGNADVYEITFTAKKDLKSPGLEERINTFKELYENDPEIRKELAKYYRSNHIKFAPLFLYEKRYKDLTDADLEKIGYNTFVRSLGDVNRKTSEKYFNALIKKGYDFVMDDMDGQYMLRYGREPAIVFDRNESLNYEGQERVRYREIRRNLQNGPIKVRNIMENERNN